MNVSRTFLQQCAQNTGFPPETLEKVIRLGTLAGEINQHPVLREILLMKGGTPLNLGFGAPSRLSVDLDYNYVGSTNRKTMVSDRPRIENILEELVSRLGYPIQRSADSFAGRKWYLRYNSAIGNSDRIEIDINYLFRIPIGDIQSLNLWQPGELDDKKVDVVPMDELCIGKILALLDRAAPRDAWDVIHLPSQAKTSLDSPRFRIRFIALSTILNHPLSSYNRNQLASRVNPNSVREQLWPMLSHGVHPTAKELVEKSWQIINPLVTLNDTEKSFVNAVAQGKFRGDLLDYDDNSLISQLEQHPAIRWKLKNVREKSSQR